MTAPEWTLAARTPNNPTPAEIPTWAGLTITEQHVATGGATVTIPANTPALQTLYAPGAQLIATRTTTGGAAHWNLPVTKIVRRYDSAGETLTVTGATEFVYLADRLALAPGETYPQGSPPDEITLQLDAAGGLAQIVAATLATHSGIATGPAWTVTAENVATLATFALRNQNLAQLIADTVATSPVPITVRVADRTVTITPARSANITLSVEAGTLTSYTETFSRPEATIALAKTKGTPELWTTINTNSPWGPIETMFAAPTDKYDNLFPLALALLANLSNAAPTVDAEATERPGCRYGIDYRLGDIVRLGPDTLPAQVTGATITADQTTGAVTVAPTFGSVIGRPGRTPRALSRIIEHERRLANLERG